MQSTSKKTIVITGCSSGIGLSCCQSALAAGHKVIATARREQDLKRLSELGAEPVALELSDEQSVKQAAEKILSLSGGHIDVLFNNAGYGLQVAMEDNQWQHLQHQMNTNVIGPVILTNQLLNAMPKGSQLIFNSSILGLITIPFRGPYCMSKYALEAAADAYRLELASKGVHVHIIEPGPIEAEFRANALEKIKLCLQGKHTRLDYSEHCQRLAADGPSKGSLPAKACADVFMAIIEGRKTKSRYLVTRTAKMAALFKRILGSHFDLVAKNNPTVILNQKRP